MRARVLAVALLAAGGGCSDDASTPSEPGSTAAALCDGSDDLRLAFAEQYGDDTASLPFEEFAGVDRPGFFVDGGCRYWSSLRPLTGWPDGTLPSITYDAGVLTADQAATLAGLVGYGALTTGTAPDAPTSDATAWTPEGGTVPDAPYTDTLIDFFTMMPRAPMTGPLRVAALAGKAGAVSSPAATWPLARPITDFVVDAHDADVEGMLVDDPDDVAKLRAMWAGWRAQPDTNYLVPVDGPDGGYLFAMHEVLPFAPNQSVTWFPGATP